MSNAYGGVGSSTTTTGKTVKFVVGVDHDFSKAQKELKELQSFFDKNFGILGKGFSKAIDFKQAKLEVQSYVKELDKLKKEYKVTEDEIEEYNRLEKKFRQGTIDGIAEEAEKFKQYTKEKIEQYDKINATSQKVDEAEAKRKENLRSLAKGSMQAVMDANKAMLGGALAAQTAMGDWRRMQQGSYKDTYKEMSKLMQMGGTAGLDPAEIGQAAASLRKSGLTGELGKTVKLAGDVKWAFNTDIGKSSEYVSFKMRKLGMTEDEVGQSMVGLAQTMKEFGVDGNEAMEVFTEFGPLLMATFSQSKEKGAEFEKQILKIQGQYKKLGISSKEAMDVVKLSTTGGAAGLNKLAYIAARTGHGLIQFMNMTPEQQAQARQQLVDNEAKRLSMYKNEGMRMAQIQLMIGSKQYEAMGLTQEDAVNQLTASKNKNFSIAKNMAAETIKLDTLEKTSAIKNLKDVVTLNQSSLDTRVKAMKKAIASISAGNIIASTGGLQDQASKMLSGIQGFMNSGVGKVAIGVAQAGVGIAGAAVGMFNAAIFASSVLGFNLAVDKFVVGALGKDVGGVGGITGIGKKLLKLLGIGGGGAAIAGETAAAGGVSAGGVALGLGMAVGTAPAWLTALVIIVGSTIGGLLGTGFQKFLIKPIEDKIDDMKKGPFKELAETCYNILNPIHAFFDYLEKSTSWLSAVVRKKNTEDTPYGRGEMTASRAARRAGAAGGMSVPTSLSGATPKNNSTGWNLSPKDTASLLKKDFASQGLTKAQSAALLAKINIESGFKPQNENLNYGSVESIKKNMPQMQSRSDEEVAKLVHNPQGLANAAYGTRNGNQGGDEGWLYRGRGFVQLTGKSNYKAVGDKIGVDLVKNPDLVNDPKYAAKVVAAYMNLRQGSVAKAYGISDLKNMTQEQANRVAVDSIGGLGYSTKYAAGQEMMGKVNATAPQFAAKGGIFNRATNLLAGEAGPEVVAPVRALISGQTDLISRTINRFAGNVQSGIGMAPNSAKVIGMLAVNEIQRQTAIQTSILNVMQEQLRIMKNTGGKTVKGIANNASIAGSPLASVIANNG